MAVAAAAAAMLGAGVAAPVAAKDYNVAGTVDCGVRSGEPCPDAASVFLWTSDVSGRDEKWEVDVTWVRDDLYGLHQDEAINFEVGISRPRSAASRRSGSAAKAAS